jgi:replication-associated recombination protein RarA
MDLFEHAMQERLTQEAPLAARLRPRTLDEVVGQEHNISQGKLLRRVITEALKRRRLHKQRFMLPVSVSFTCIHV